MREEESGSQPEGISHGSRSGADRRPRAAASLSTCRCVLCIVPGHKAEWKGGNLPARLSTLRCLEKGGKGRT